MLLCDIPSPGCGIGLRVLLPYLKVTTHFARSHSESASTRKIPAEGLARTPQTSLNKKQSSLSTLTARKHERVSFSQNRLGPTAPP